MRINRCVLSGLLATLALAGAVGAASANRLSASSQSIRMVWSSLRFEALMIRATITCAVTMEGTFHGETIVKTRDSLVGSITRASFGQPCTGGSVWAYNGTEGAESLPEAFTNSLPWHLTYESFVGTLPSITEVNVRLIGMRWARRAAFLGVPVICTFETGTEDPAEFSAKLGRGGTVLGIRPNEADSIPADHSGVCGPEELYNEAAITGAGGTSLRLTLI